MSVQLEPDMRATDSTHLYTNNQLNVVLKMFCFYILR